MRPVLRWLPMNATTFRMIASLERAVNRRWTSPWVELTEHRLGDVRVECMRHRLGPASDLTILYFHGGGFFSGSIATHRRICANLARFSGAGVVSVDYVQLPVSAVAASVQDCINAYAGLLDECRHRDKIVLAGDSAGGYLAMKVAELATRRGLQAPAAILAFSPLLSLDPEREDKAVRRIDPIHDAYLPRRRIRGMRALWRPEGSIIEGFEAPLDASEYITSPTFMTTVEDELLRPEVEALSVLLADHGVRVDTHIWRKQVHAFPFLADFLPEGRQALQLAAAFARSAVGELVSLDRPIARAG
jgi:acetyl esterase/lipase